MERSATSAHLGGSLIYPKGVSEESVPLTRFIFDEPFDDSHQILVGRLDLPISLGVIRWWGEMFDSQFNQKLSQFGINESKTIIYNNL